MGKELIDYSKEHIIKRYFFWAILAALIIISFFIVKPFIIALISAFILSFFIKPIYDRMSKRINNKAAALFSVLIILVIILIPLLILIGGLVAQINYSRSIDLNQITNKISSYSNTIDLNQIKSFILSFLSSALTSAISYIPILIISMLIMLMGIYYILINWDYLSQNIEYLLPFKDKKRVKSEISEITKNIVYGYLLVAILELIIGMVGFYIAGVNSYLILSMLIAILAFIPGLGPAIVWAPAALYNFIVGETRATIIIIITGLIISLVVELFIRTKIVSKKANIHPLIFLIGALGGVSIFGITGFIIGPLILVYSIKIIKESLNQR